VLCVQSGLLLLNVLVLVVEFCGNDYTILARGGLAYVPPTVIANGEQSLSHSRVQMCPELCIAAVCIPNLRYTVSCRGVVWWWTVFSRGSCNF
jgi:hypothetical protein